MFQYKVNFYHDFRASTVDSVLPSATIAAVSSSASITSTNTTTTTSTTFSAVTAVAAVGVPLPNPLLLATQRTSQLHKRHSLTALSLSSSSSQPSSPLNQQNQRHSVELLTLGATSGATSGNVAIASSTLPIEVVPVMSASVQVTPSVTSPRVVVGGVVGGGEVMTPVSPSGVKPTMIPLSL